LTDSILYACVFYRKHTALSETSLMFLFIFENAVDPGFISIFPSRETYWKEINTCAI